MELTPTKFADFFGGLHHGPCEGGDGTAVESVGPLGGDWPVEMAKLRARDASTSGLDGCHTFISRTTRQSDVYWFGTGHALLLNLTWIFITDFG